MAISCIYDGSESCVKIENEFSEFFKVNTGVLQGDTLAPFLFIVVLNYILSQNNHGLQTHTDYKLPDLDFADDIAQLDSSIEEAIQHFTEIELHANSVGLKVNYTKTKVLGLNNNITDMKLPNGQIIQAVTDFKYLGSKIMHSFNDFKQRRGIAFSIGR